MKSRIYIGEILTDRLIFLNQITFRCDILVIRNQIDPVFQSIRNVIGIFSSCRSITSCLRSSLCCISRGYSTGIFQRILNIGNITLQLLVCCIAGLSFSKIIFIELIGNRSNVFVNRIDRTYQTIIDPFDNLILRSISTNAGCNFLMKSRIYIGEILTDRLIFLNQITFRCDILVSGFLIDLVIEGIISGFTGSSLIADGLLVGRNIRGVILCRRLSIFQL